MFDTLRNSIAKIIAPRAVPAPRPRARTAMRMYAGAKLDRLTAGWAAGSTSADSEIYGSLRVLRNRARELERDNDYAKQVVRLFKNNVVGRGIGLQAQVMMRRGEKLDDASNDAIEAAWARWCRKQFCSSSGRYSYTQILRMIASAQPTSGEILIRKVRQPFGGGKVPFALEVIEADQLVDNLSIGRAENGNVIKMGVEMDQWNRPVAYWLYPKHPGDLMFIGQPQTNRYQRVPASEVIHLFVHDDRPLQTRGVPGFHTALRRLNNMGGYEEAEIVAARASACYMGFIETPDEDGVGQDAVQDGERVTNLEAGEIKELAPGEKFSSFAPSRPNTAMEGFMRFMLRGMAAGCGVSYESVSRDYSQSNFSSSRMALLDDRDNWRVLQDWLIAEFCQPVFEEWLDAAVQAEELKLPGYFAAREAFQAVRWKPRGWSYIDPLKDTMADKLRVRSGFTSVASVIADEGEDYEDVFKQRRREIDLAKELKLVLETDPALVNDKGQVQPDPAAAAAAAQGQGADTTSDNTTEGEAGGAKELEMLYTTLERALNTNRDALALQLLERIDAIEAALEKQAAAA